MRRSDPSNVRLRRCLESFSALPDGAKIMEAGCGGGLFIRAIKKLRPLWQCHGSDISREAIGAAMAMNDGVIYTASEENKLPYGDSEFDGIAFFDVLEHVGNPELFLKEIYRVLKPGGILYAFVPCEGDAMSLWNLLGKLGVKKELTKKYAGHINNFSRKNVYELLGRCGFKIEKISYAEHLFGQIIGVAVFSALDREAKKTGQAVNNEEYFRRAGVKQGIAGRFLRKTANFLVSLESELFSAIPSPNIHIIARKI